MDANALAKAALARGVTIEDVLRELRDAGFNQIDSVKALRDAAGMTLAEADIAVLESDTWADQRDLTLRLRDDFWAVIGEHADEIETDPDGKTSATFDLTRYRENDSGTE